MRSAKVAWWVLAVSAAGLALVAIGHWVWAVTLDGPVLYGEGAVAHAALLARDRLEYVPVRDTIFIAANYPPLYFHLASLADPFIGGRVESIAATLFVAGAIAWRARAASPLVALALALGWLATAPVSLWGAAVKPDLVALALTVAAVLAVEVRRSGPLLAGALLGLAVSAKPTAFLPALALAAYLASRDRAGLAKYLASGGVAGLAVALATVAPDGSMYLHVVDWNGLPWRPALAATLALVALVVLAVPLVASGAVRAPRGAVGAYVIAGAGIVLLGGREGATINYLLDLSAGLALALAGVAQRLRSSVTFPLASVLQLAVGVALLNPFSLIPDRPVTTGAWGAPERITAFRRHEGAAPLPLSDALLVEDAGLLVATGREPAVDDLFLWSRLLERGGSFREGDALLRAVRDARFAAIVSEVDLAHLDDAPAFERQRWAAPLVSAVLKGYRLDRQDGTLWIYRPR